MTPFLERLAAPDRDAIRALLQLRSFRAGEMVLSQQDPSHDAYFVLQGVARATLYSPDGKTVAYRDIGEGEIFGEISAIDGAPRSASVVASGPLTVGRMPQAELRRQIENRPGFAWALLTHLTQQSRAMTERIFEFSTLLVRDRLLRELLRLADANGGLIRPAPTHQDLANRISTHREAVSRLMSELAREGLIERGKGEIRLRDPEALRALGPGGR